MECWTRTKEQRCWEPWPNPLEGLASLAVRRVEEVLLLALHPDEELPDLLASVRLMRITVGSSVRVIVASPHPSDAWLNPLREAGIDQLWWVERPKTQRLSPETLTVRTQDLAGPVCPALHAATEHGKTLSLCGRHDDRMVLAVHHLQRWCLRDREQCPHWKFGPGWLGEDGP